MTWVSVHVVSRPFLPEENVKILFFYFAYIVGTSMNRNSSITILFALKINQLFVAGQQYRVIVQSRHISLSDGVLGARINEHTTWKLQVYRD